jgi:hypothetical protein
MHFHRPYWLPGCRCLVRGQHPVAKLLVGSLSPFLLAGLLYLGSGIGLTLVRLYRDRGWKTPGLPASEWPWLLCAIATGGVVGPVLADGRAGADRSGRRPAA